MMAVAKYVPPRLFLLLAREAYVGVIFRRGPAKWNHIIKWDTQRDVLEYGQWFKGRIYERRCDLSPDGTKLIYFASKFNKKTLEDKEYTYAWTAISKPPYLTALALWPKGDCWHGGGMFIANNEVLLNHKPDRAVPHPLHQPHNLIVNPNPNARGEDDPLYSKKLERDGWIEVDEGVYRMDYENNRGFVTIRPSVRELKHPKEPYSIRMGSIVSGFYVREEFEILNITTGLSKKLPKAQWACWDHRGRAAVLGEGKLMIGEIDSNKELLFHELADFNADKPEEIQAPSWARGW